MYYVYAAINKLASIIAHHHHLKPSGLGFFRVVGRAGLSLIFAGRFSCLKSIGPSPQHNHASAKVGERRVCWLSRIGLEELFGLRSIRKLLKPTMHLQNTGRRKDIQAVCLCGSSVMVWPFNKNCFSLKEYFRFFIQHFHQADGFQFRVLRKCLTLYATYGNRPWLHLQIYERANTSNFTHSFNYIRTKG